MKLWNRSNVVRVRSSSIARSALAALSASLAATSCAALSAKVSGKPSVDESGAGPSSPQEFDAMVKQCAIDCYKPEPMTTNKQHYQGCGYIRVFVIEDHQGGGVYTDTPRLNPAAEEARPVACSQIPARSEAPDDFQTVIRKVQTKLGPGEVVVFPKDETWGIRKNDFGNPEARE